MMLATIRSSHTHHSPARRRSAFTLLEVLVVVAILVILATVATIATTRYIEEARKSKAQLGCKSIETAIEAYQTSASNPGLTDQDRMPQDISQLSNVPFGCPSFLKDGQSNTIDPWGKPYQFEPRQRADGTSYIFVHTTAQDGTPISQYGIGPQNSQPKN
jgi:general secretion pathway protein G